MRRNAKMHLYIRLDASGYPIPGSDILRKKMPGKQQGRYIDITSCSQLCCNFVNGSAYTITSTEDGFTGNLITLMSVAGTTVTVTTFDHVIDGLHFAILANGDIGIDVVDPDTDLAATIVLPIEFIVNGEPLFENLTIEWDYTAP